MTGIFGEVAELYDDARPGYPDAVRRQILAYGGAPSTVVELGAGTGKATELLLRLDAPLTAIEPDPRMAAVLRAKFPGITVAGTTFEEWAPPAGGVGLVACATAWHWMDPATRHRRAFDALTPGGMLAVFHHKFAYADPAQWVAIDELLHRIDPDVADRDEHWVCDDVSDAAIWADVQEHRWHTYPTFSKRRYLDLMQTFSPFRKHAPEVRQRTLDELDVLLDDFGGALTLDLRTTVVLARRP